MSTGRDDPPEQADEQLVERVNRERALRRGYIVFATDPTVAPDEHGYRHVFATEACTARQAMAKVRPLASDRGLRAFLATGAYRHELPNGSLDSMIGAFTPQRPSPSSPDRRIR